MTFPVFSVYYFSSKRTVQIYMEVGLGSKRTSI